MEGKQVDPERNVLRLFPANSESENFPRNSPDLPPNQSDRAVSFSCHKGSKFCINLELFNLKFESFNLVAKLHKTYNDYNFDPVTAAGLRNRTNNFLHGCSPESAVCSLQSRKQFLDNDCAQFALTETLALCAVITRQR